MTEENQQTTLEDKIKAVLDNEIRPMVARDGGDVTYEGFEEGVVKLKLRGACSGCPSASITLKMVIESHLRQLFPEIKEVVSVN